MIKLVEDSLNGVQIPEIGETEEDKELSIGQLKYKYLQFSKQNFQGKVFTNRNTEKPVRVSSGGLMEWWRKSRRREHIVAVYDIDKFRYFSLKDIAIIPE